MSESHQEFDISDWLDPVPAMRRAETAVAPIYAPPSGMRAFPIGFHCAAPDPDCPCAPDGLCTSACPTPEADPDCTQSCLFDGGSCLGQHASTSGSSGSGTGSDDSGCNAAGGIGLAAWLILGIGLALTRRRG